MNNSVSVGDHSKKLLMQHTASGLKKRLSKLSIALTSGNVANVNDATQGDYKHLAAINHQQQLNSIHQKNNEKIGQDLGALQAVLQKITAPMKGLSVQFLDATAFSGSTQIDRTIAEGSALFTQTVADLNASTAGRTLLSGTATDQRATASAANISFPLKAHIADLVTVSEIAAAVDVWFMTEGAGFDQHAYMGDAPATDALPVGHKTDIYGPNISAASPEIRNVLAQLAKVSLLSELSFDDIEKSELIQEAGRGLLSAEQGLLNLSAGLGQIEERIEQNKTHLSFEAAAIDVARHSIIAVDQFKTANELQNTLAQLDAVYTLTARSANLSLVGYLR